MSSTTDRQINATTGAVPEIKKKGRVGQKKQDTRLLKLVFDLIVHEVK